MSVTVSERANTRKGSGNNYSREYIIRGCETEDEARVALFDNAETSINGLALNTISSTVEEIEFTNGIWIGTANYERLDWGFQPTDSFSVSIDIEGETYKRKTSIATKYAYGTGVAGEVPAGGVSVFNNAINVENNAHQKVINGVDFVVPYATLKLNYTFPADVITSAFMGNVYKCVGKTNAAELMGFEAGTMLLTQMSGASRADNNWNISYGFGLRENRTDLTVGRFTNVKKGGWQYLWEYWTEVKVDGRFVPFLSNVFVEQIYYSTDYSVLFNGQTPVWSADTPIGL